MCYLKKFQRISIIPSSKSHIVDDTDAYSSDQSVSDKKNQNAFFAINNLDKYEANESKPTILMNLLSLINYNTVLMGSLQMKIDKNNESLDSLSTQILEKPEKFEQNTKTQIQIEEIEEINSKSQHFSDQALTQKLFGKKIYKYKLILTQQFPQIIYKQRNISFSVNLTTSDGLIVRNCNMINLCLGVSDSNGEWISQTRNGENFMKGKTQAELYHGQSNYSKIYPRDVSRSYENGKVHFVVYPKPSMLHYSGNNSALQSKVNFEEIEPVIIKDLTIRAKKKD